MSRGRNRKKPLRDFPPPILFVDFLFISMNGQQIQRQKGHHMIKQYGLKAPHQFVKIYSSFEVIAVRDAPDYHFQ